MMPAAAARISRWRLGVVWLFAAMLVASLAWAPLGGSVPWRAARDLAAVPLVWIIVSCYFVTAVWLSVPAWHDTGRLQVALGMSLASAIWGFFLSLSLGF